MVRVKKKSKDDVKEEIERIDRIILNIRHAKREKEKRKVNDIERKLEVRLG
jgi:hypothetical protein